LTLDELFVVLSTPAVEEVLAVDWADVFSDAALVIVCVELLPTAVELTTFPETVVPAGADCILTEEADTAFILKAGVWCCLTDSPVPATNAGCRLARNGLLLAIDAVTDGPRCAAMAESCQPVTRG